jgi:hypothetical protein
MRATVSGVLFFANAGIAVSGFQVQHGLNLRQPQMFLTECLETARLWFEGRPSMARSARTHDWRAPVTMPRKC